MSLLFHPLRSSHLTLSGMMGAPAEALRLLAQEWSVYRASAALHALDEAGLRDIGVPRGDIETAVRHGRAGLSV